MAAAREARRARSEQDVNPWRVLGFAATVVALSWLWLGPAWAVVAAVFVVPPSMIIAIQWRVRGPLAKGMAGWAYARAPQGVQLTSWSDPPPRSGAEGHDEPA